MPGVVKEQLSKLNVGTVKGAVGDVVSVKLLIGFQNSDSFLHDVMGVSGKGGAKGGTDDGNAGSVGV